MGCFLACFGSSKDAKRGKQRRKVPPRHRKNGCGSPELTGVSSVRDYSKTLLGTASEVQAKPEEQLNASTRKKVTFDSYVKTYEPVLPHEVADFPPEKGEEGGEEEALVKSSQSKSYSEDSYVTSTESCPLNHRYQNSRDSDDEDEEMMDYGDSDLADEDEDDDEDGDSDMGEEYSELGEDFEDGMVYSRSSGRSVANHVVAEEVDSPILMCDKDVKSVGLNPNARDRSVYVHPVLNPVENLTQWKAVKAKRTPPLMPQKENYILNQESRIAFSAEPSFKELSFSLKSEIDPSKKLNREIAVDASLSNWLVSSETTPVNKPSSVALYADAPDRCTSHGSNSVISHEDRPILGALTVEELKQFSASSSPRKSPSRSPDEMPIIGTVGTYWNFLGSAEDCGSATSSKGVPDTTSKYRGGIGEVKSEGN